MDSTVLLMVIMGIMLLGVAFLVFRFVQSVRVKRAYMTEELPDLDETEAEDEVLPDIEESGFSSLENDFQSDEESASEIYREISEANYGRNGR